MSRIIATLVILFSVLFLPFWVTGILAFCGIVYFEFFLEGVFLMLLVDLLYGVQEQIFFNFYFVTFLVSLVLLFSLKFFKRKTRIII